VAHGPPCGYGRALVVRPHGSDRAPSPGGTPAAEDFWGALGPEDARELKALGVVRTFARGRVLLHEGQVPDRVLVLRSGRVKVTSSTVLGREVVLAFRGPGELVGELAAIDEEPRSATVQALEPVEALVLDRGRFRTFVATHPAASLTLLQMLSRRLRDADEKRIELSAYTTIERVAGRVLELSGRFGVADEGGVRVALSQEELAGATGSSVESVARALQTMRSLKCIETRRREIRVLDAEALEALRRPAG
jgi:CRP-like cAMP-binding protein